MVDSSAPHRSQYHSVGSFIAPHSRHLSVLTSPFAALLSESGLFDATLAANGFSSAGDAGAMPSSSDDDGPHWFSRFRCSTAARHPRARSSSTPAAWRSTAADHAWVAERRAAPFLSRSSPAGLSPGAVGFAPGLGALATDRLYGLSQAATRRAFGHRRDFSRRRRWTRRGNRSRPSGLFGGLSRSGAAGGAGAVGPEWRAAAAGEGAGAAFALHARARSWLSAEARWPLAARLSDHRLEKAELVEAPAGVVKLRGWRALGRRRRRRKNSLTRTRSASTDAPDAASWASSASTSRNASPTADVPNSPTCDRSSISARSSRCCSISSSIFSSFFS